MNCSGLLLGPKHREQAEEWLEPRARTGQRRVDRPPRALAIAGQREHECVGSHRRRIAPRKQWLKRCRCAANVFRYCQAQRQPPPRFIALRTRQRRAIIGLRPRLLAEQVERQPAIERQHRRRCAEGLRLVEHRHRPLGVAHHRHRRADPDLGRRAGRIIFLRPSEKSRCSLHVAHFERGATGGHQRRQILRLSSEDVHRLRQGRAGIDRDRRRGIRCILRRCRKGWRGERGKNEQSAGRAGTVILHATTNGRAELAPTLLKVKTRQRVAGRR